MIERSVIAIFAKVIGQGAMSQGADLNDHLKEKDEDMADMSEADIVNGTAIRMHASDHHHAAIHMPELGTTDMADMIDMDHRAIIMSAIDMAAHQTVDMHHHHQEIMIDTHHHVAIQIVMSREVHRHQQQIKGGYRHVMHTLGMIHNPHGPTPRNHRHILHHRQQGDFSIQSKEQRAVISIIFYSLGTIVMTNYLASFISCRELFKLGGRSLFFIHS